MATMMEAMLSMKKIMEGNMAIVTTTSAATEVNPTHPSGLNQVNPPVSDMVGQRGEALESTGDPHFVQVQNKHSSPQYGLPPNYMPPDVAHTPNEDVNNFALMPIESQQPQYDHAYVSQPMGETHEAPRDHILANFEPHLGYAAEGQAFCDVPLLNTLGGPQYHQQLQPLHFKMGIVLPAMMVGCTPSSFADLVFAGERIEVGLRRNKFHYPALMNRKPGANGESKNGGGTYVVAVIPTWPNFPPAQQCHYLANIDPSHYPPPYQPRALNHPQRPPLNQPQSSPAAHQIPNTTLNTNQNTNQGRSFPAKKPIEFTPILVSYANLLPYLLNNAMVAITPAKVPQPPFFRGYNFNTICVYHGGVSGHSIEHCMTLKHKVQNLIDAGWLKFEEDNRL
ncbi:hypothetical protein HKD37_07G019352 [Glycine soja]|nr:hypothetical protein GmHk_07G019690 [Glycine max]